MGSKRLIVTADDFGVSENINEGIVNAAEAGAITTISAMTNFRESLSELKDLSVRYPGIGIGVHLNIVTGKPVLQPEAVPSLVDENGNFYTLDNLLKNFNRLSVNELRNELNAQINVLLDSGIKLDHLSDQCGVISLYSPFFEIMSELATVYTVPVRSPRLASFCKHSDFTNSKLKKRGRRLVCSLAIKAPFKALELAGYCNRKEMERKIQDLDNKGVRHPDLFIDGFWGEPGYENFRKILENLPAGTSEIVVHLGNGTRQDSYPTGLDIDYFECREKELETITSPLISSLYQEFGINRIGYSGLNQKLFKGSPY